MASQTKYLTEATLFGPAANKWAATSGIMNNNGGLTVLRTTSNLSDLTDTVAARVNLGLRIGADVQPYSERLNAYAGGVAPSAFSLAAMGKATAADWRDFLEVGTVSSVTVSGGNTGLVFSGGTITDSGTATLTGTLAVTNGGTGVTSLAAFKTALALNNVNNTSDINKPVSTAMQTELDKKLTIPTGTANQYVRGDGGLGTMPTFPETGIGTVTQVNLDGGTTGLSFVGGPITTDQTLSLGGTLALTHGGTGVSTLSALKILLGIDQVDNTSDLNKPVSTATLASLDRRVRIPSSMPIGTSLELPVPVAGKVIGWSDDGLVLVNKDPGTGGSNDPGVAYINVNVFTGDGVETEFTLSSNPGSLNNVEVTVGGIAQTPTLNYTLEDDNVVTFTAAPPAGEPIVIRFFRLLASSEISAEQIRTGVFTGNLFPDDTDAKTILQLIEDEIASIKIVFDNKEDKFDAGTLTQYLRGDKSWAELDKAAVGLSAVDNTADMDKPVSVATQAALLGKISKPIGFDPEVDLHLPTPEAGKVIGWNLSETALINIEPGTGSGGSGQAIFHVDIFTGNGIETEFTLSDQPASINSIEVSVGGVDQTPGDAYTWDGGTTLIFSEAIPDGRKVVVRYADAVEFGETTADLVQTTNFSGSTIPDGSSVQAALQALETALENNPGSGGGSGNAIITSEVLTGDGITTSFVLENNPGTVNNLVVDIGGVLQTATLNYSWNSSTNAIVFSEAPDLDEVITVRVFSVFAIDPDTVGVTRVDTFIGNAVATTFELSYEPYSLESIEVFVAGVVQVPGVNYTLDAPKTIVFSDPIPNDYDIFVRYGSSYFGQYIPSVSKYLDTLTADGVTTEFELSFNPGHINNLDVTVGGIYQQPGVDYVFTRPNILTFAEAIEADLVVLVKGSIINLVNGNIGSASDITTEPFTGSIIPDDSSVQEALQALETAIGDGVPSGASDIATDNFSGDIIPNGANVQSALQSLETAIENIEVGEAVVPVARFDIFEGDGIKSDFELTYEPSSFETIEVFVGGVVQLPGEDYTLVDPQSILFDEAIDAGVKILIRYGNNLSHIPTVSVSRDTFVGDDTTVEFELSFDPGYSNNLTVTVGGIVQSLDQNYTFTPPNIITFVDPPSSGSYIVVTGFRISVIGETSASLVHTDNFSGDLLPDSSNVQDVLQIVGDAVVSKASFITAPPSSSSSTGSKGSISCDTDFLYICVATNSWKRIALSSW